MLCVYINCSRDTTSITVSCLWSVSAPLTHSVCRRLLSSSLLRLLMCRVVCGRVHSPVESSRVSSRVSYGSYCVVRFASLLPRLSLSLCPLDPLSPSHSHSHSSHLTSRHRTELVCSSSHDATRLDSHGMKRRRHDTQSIEQTGWSAGAKFELSGREERERREERAWAAATNHVYQ